MGKKSLIKTGTATLANCRISGVAAGAFVDGTAAWANTDFIGQWIEIKDSAGKRICGYVKSIGVGGGTGPNGETLGGEEIVNGTFAADTDWQKGTNWTIPLDNTLTLGTPAMWSVTYQLSALTTPTQKLYYTSFDITNFTSGNALLKINGTLDVLGTARASAATFTQFLNAGPSPNGNFSITTSAANSVLKLSNLSVKQVTAPSTSGILISSTPFGATQSWTFQESGFNYNDSSGYTYYIYSTGSKVAASGTVAAGSAKMDCTTSNSFGDFGGTINLAQWAGSDTGVRRYQLIVTDSAGKSFRAWIGAAGSGPTTSSVTVNNSDFTSDEPPGTAWTRDAGWTVSGGVGVASSAGAGISIYQSVLSSPNGKLYSASWDLVSRTAGSFVFRLGGQTQSYVSTPATYTYYITPIASTATVVIYAGGAGTSGTIDNIVINQITEPASTGVHLFSTSGAGGVHTRSYASIDSGFNPNLALTYKVIDCQPNLGQLLYTTTISAGSLKCDTTDTNAFCDWGATVPLSGFAGIDGYTPYLLVLQDSAGKIKYGYVSVADSGEALAAAKDVDGITKANPGVVTYAAGHGYSNGQVIYFSGLTEMTNLNTKYRTLINNSGDTFQINDTSSYAAAETTGGNCSQNLTHCASTGCLIVSTKNGATRAWNGDSTFNPNLQVIVRVYKTY